MTLDQLSTVRDSAHAEQTTSLARITDLQEQLAESRAVTRDAALALSFANEKMAVLERELTNGDTRENTELRDKFSALVQDVFQLKVVERVSSCHSSPFLPPLPYLPTTALLTTRPHLLTSFTSCRIICVLRSYDYLFQLDSDRLYPNLQGQAGAAARSKGR